MRPQSILVVEDTQDIRTMLRIVLERAGYAPTIVATGAAALQELATSAYALLLTDLYLPDMTGRELIIQSHRFPQTPPAVLMSGTDWDCSGLLAGNGSAVEFLAKPFSITDLLATIAYVLIPLLLGAQVNATAHPADRRRAAAPSLCRS
jgi:DNA-binding response OmpR family regulator